MYDLDKIIYFLRERKKQQLIKLGRIQQIQVIYNILNKINQ